MDQRTEIIPVQLEDGTIIQVMATMLDKEVDVAAFEQVTPFSGAMNTVEKIARVLVKTINKVAPDKASVEFGIELAYKEGTLTGLLVKGATTGNLTITLTWGK